MERQAETNKRGCVWGIMYSEGVTREAATPPSLRRAVLEEKE